MVSLPADDSEWAVAALDTGVADEDTSDDADTGAPSQDDGAFEGQVVGKAPGVWLMPVTVLDEDNAATRST